MKRSELNVGDEIIVGGYGSRAVVADLRAWETPGDWSPGFTISKAQFELAKLDPIKAGYAAVSESRGGRFTAGMRLRDRGGPTILVRAYGGRLRVAGLGSVRLASDYEAEEAQRREAMQSMEERVRADGELIRELPAELRADRAHTYGHGGNHSRIQQGRVSVDLTALIELIGRGES